MLRPFPLRLDRERFLPATLSICSDGKVICFQTFPLLEACHMEKRAQRRGARVLLTSAKASYYCFLFVVECCGAGLDRPW